MKKKGSILLALFMVLNILFSGFGGSLAYAQETSDATSRTEVGIESNDTKAGLENPALSANTISIEKKQDETANVVK
ncbi:MAG: hypothetical protein SPI74_01930 [Eubacterium sp.]|nr:hypothetical protein [Eubacterium sp.]